jgi:hypothetical protein
MSTDHYSLKEETPYYYYDTSIRSDDDNDEEEDEVPIPERGLTEVDYLAFVLNKCTSLEEFALVNSRANTA